jgi:hypothetical protein
MSINKLIKKTYFFQDKYSEKFLFNMFNDIFEYLKIIESQSTKTCRKFYSIACIKYHCENNMNKVDKINYCIEVKEEFTGVVLLYFLRYYNFLDRNIIDDFINEIECTLKYEHDQEDFTITSYMKKSKRDDRNKWLRDNRWTKYFFTFCNLLETIFFYQMYDTLIWENNLHFGQRDTLYICPIIGTGALYINKLPFEDFEKYSVEKHMKNVETKIVRIEDIIL